jgi:RNA polymerase sigma-70 factor, ECF subfamily
VSWERPTSLSNTPASRRFNVSGPGRVLTYEGHDFVRLRPDGSFVVPTAFAMSRVSQDEGSRDVAETARLVRLTLAGDSTAFEQIILRYEARVMTVAARLLGGKDDARDVAQEVFLRAFKYLHRLNLQKPMEPWLIQITINACRDAARQRQRRRDTFVEMNAPETVDESANPYTDVAREQERLILQKALDMLPEKERLAVLLRDVEGLSTAEVASVLHSSETTVRSQVSRGRLRLRAAINQLMGGKA